MDILLYTFLGACIGYATGCDPGWVRHGQMCYHFSHDTETWDDAAEMCRDVHNGKLLEIEDFDENNFVENQVRLFNTTYWIGLSDRDVEGTWVWMTSQTPLTTTGYSDWAPGEPNSYTGEEDCVFLFTYTKFHWTDGPCSSFAYYICEKPHTSN